MTVCDRGRGQKSSKIAWHTLWMAPMHCSTPFQCDFYSHMCTCYENANINTKVLCGYRTRDVCISFSSSRIRVSRLFAIPTVDQLYYAAAGNQIMFNLFQFADSVPGVKKIDLIIAAVVGSVLGLILIILLVLLVLRFGWSICIN